MSMLMAFVVVTAMMFPVLLVMTVAASALIKVVVRGGDCGCGGVWR